MNLHRHVVLIAVFALSLTASCTDSDSSTTRNTPEPDSNISDTNEDTHDPPADSTSDTKDGNHASDSGHDTDDSGAGCENNTQVGWTAELSRMAHQVSGTAVIEDSNTIRIDNFSYDGDGPDVYVYVADCANADAGNWEKGTAISEKLTSAYTDETVRFSLPQDLEVASIGGISIWCSEFSANFGSGLFTPPA